MSPPDAALYGTAEDFNAAIDELRLELGQDSVTIDPEILLAHGFSKWTYYAPSLPSVVVYVNSTEDVVKVVGISRKWKVPIVAHSSGTALEGQFFAPPVGGISVDLSRMNKILEIHEGDGDLVCQAGARWDDINAELKKRGIPLFFPLDPGHGASIGGMIATGCSGTNAVRYGTGRAEWFLNLTVVLPSGEVIKTRRRARKSSVGFDTSKIFIGAEGTLGIVTEATIRLAPLLPTSVAYVHFPDASAAVRTTTEVLNKGVPIQCAELMDASSVRVMNLGGMLPVKLPELLTVFYKFQGTTLSRQEAASISKDVAEKHGGTGFTFFETEEDAEKVWLARKMVLIVAIKLNPGRKCIITDVCVPMSKLPQLLKETEEDCERTGVIGSMAGHIGDGNFHAALIFTNDEELKLAKEVGDRLVHRAIALDGTCTGEHGVGIGKRQYMEPELGPSTIAFMKQIKRTIDPLALFNPGKLYPDD